MGRGTQRGSKDAATGRDRFIDNDGILRDQGRNGGGYLVRIGGAIRQGRHGRHRNCGHDFRCADGLCKALKRIDQITFDIQNRRDVASIGQQQARFARIGEKATGRLVPTSTSSRTSFR